MELYQWKSISSFQLLQHSHLSFKSQFPAQISCSTPNAASILILVHPSSGGLYFTRFSAVYLRLYCIWGILVLLYDSTMTSAIATDNWEISLLFSKSWIFLAYQVVQHNTTTNSISALVLFSANCCNPFNKSYEVRV